MKITDCMETDCPFLIATLGASDFGIIDPTGQTFHYECAKDFEFKADCMKGLPQKDKFTIKDSGERQIFSTGMQRDSQRKIRYDLIPLFLFDRLAEHMTKGAEKYSPRNWQKAQTTEELERFIASVYRHFFEYMANETDEDHFSAIIFNLCGIEMVKAKLKNEKILLTPMEDVLNDK